MSDAWRDGCKLWNGPVVVNGREYRFPVDPVKRDGTQIYAVTVGMANYVAGLPLSGTTVDIGCGCGLPGMIAGATLIERDEQTVAVTRQTLDLNDSACHLLNANWNDVNERFDNIIGSELFFPAYDLPGLAAFIDRCWTRRGKCLFANSRITFVERFENALNAHRLPRLREEKSYADFDFYLWSIFGA